MSDLKSAVIFEAIQSGLENMDAKEKQQNIKKANGIFEMHIKKGSEEKVWTIDLKKEGKVYEGSAKPKADVTITVNDDVFMDLADGKLNGQKAFMSGKLKVKGNIMLATKLDGVLSGYKPKL